MEWIVGADADQNKVRVSGVVVMECAVLNKLAGRIPAMDVTGHLEDSKCTNVLIQLRSVR